MTWHKLKEHICEKIGSYAKNYTVGEQIDKIVKNGSQIDKKLKCSIKKDYFFCSFYVILSLHAKNVFVGRMGWLVANLKTKRKNSPENASKNIKN